MLDEVVLTFFSRLQVFLNTSAQEIYSLQSHFWSFLSTHFVRNLCEAMMFFWRFIDTFSATKFGFGEWLMKETAVSIRINWKRVREGLRLWGVMGRELVLREFRTNMNSHFIIWQKKSIIYQSSLWMKMTLSKKS